MHQWEHNRRSRRRSGTWSNRLEQVVADQGSEVRTRRLVVVNHQDTERIVGEVVPDGTAEVRMDLPGRPVGERTSLLLFANPGDEASWLPSGVGVHLWVDGDAVRERSMPGGTTASDRGPRRRGGGRPAAGGCRNASPEQ